MPVFQINASFVGKPMLSASFDSGTYAERFSAAALTYAKAIEQGAVEVKFLKIVGEFEEMVEDYDSRVPA